MDDETRIAHLIFKHLRQETSMPEEEELQAWIAQSPEHGKFMEAMISSNVLDDSVSVLLERDDQAMEESIEHLLGWEQPSRRLDRTWWYGVAACLGLTVVFLIWQLSPRHTAVQAPSAADVARQMNFSVSAPYDALLILGDNSHVILDKARERTRLASQGNISLVSTGESLLYKDSSNTGIREGPGEINTLYNTVVTQGQRSLAIIMVDGSKVMLANRSTLRYPVGFNDPAREVDLEGQAYFEVSADKSRPFIVKYNGIQFVAKGTQFRITAYQGDAIRITLFKGSVTVVNRTSSKELEPGQEASVTENDMVIQKMTEPMPISWNTETPQFIFNNTPFPVVMRQIADWYKVTLSNPEGAHGIPVTGELPMNLPLSELLKRIEEVEDGSAYLSSRNDTVIITASKPAP